MSNSNRRPTPGPQRPEKYPVAPGPAYLQYGEQPGLIYDPYRDVYTPDPKQSQDYYEETGLAKKEPKAPSLTSQLLPIGAAAGVGALGYYGAKELIEKGPGGMFGGDPPKVPAGQPATPTGATGAQGPTGMMSSAPPPGPQAPGATQGPTSAALPPIDPSVVPAGGTIPEGYTAIGSSADGGTMIAPTEAVNTGSVNWGAVGQGVLGAYQLYNAYDQFKQGNTLGAGVNAVGGATLVGSALGNEFAASALPVVGPVVGAYGAYELDKYVSNAPSGGRRNTNATLQGASAGAAIGSAFGPAGAGIGAGIGALTGLGMSVFGSSKDKYQMIRDEARKGLKEMKILDDNYQGTLADGTKFDFGKDGKGFGEINYEDAATGKVIGLANVISAGEGMYGRGTDAMSMLYTNAAMSNAGGDYEKARQNMLHFAQQRGFTQQNVTEQLTKMKEAGQIDESQFSAYQAGLNELFRGNPAPPNNSQAPSGMMSPDKQTNLNQMTPEQMVASTNNKNPVQRPVVRRPAFSQGGR